MTFGFWRFPTNRRELQQQIREAYTMTRAPERIPTPPPAMPPPDRKPLPTKRRLVKR